MTLLSWLSEPCLDLAFCGSLVGEVSMGCFTGELSALTLANSVGFMKFAAVCSALPSLLLSEVSFSEGTELTCVIVLERLAPTLPLSLPLVLAVFKWSGLMVAHTALAFALASLEGVWPFLSDAAVPFGGALVFCWDAVDWM